MGSFTKYITDKESLDKMQEAGFTYNLETLRSGVIFFKNGWGDIVISKSQHRKNVVYLDSSFLQDYGISYESIGYQRAWEGGNEDIPKVYAYIFDTLLPCVTKLRGPYKVGKEKCRDTIISVMAKYKYEKYTEGKKIFQIPFVWKDIKTNEILQEMSSQIEFEYLEYELSSESHVYFDIERGCSGFVFSHNEKNWEYLWFKYASVMSEGVECIQEIVEGFIKDWKNLIDAPIHIRWMNK